MSKFLLSVVSALLVAGSAFAAQCAATTKKGAQCKNEAVAGSQYCALHAKKFAAATNTTVKAASTTKKAATTTTTKKAHRKAAKTAE